MKWLSPLAGVGVALVARWVPYGVYLVVLALFGVGPDAHHGAFHLLPLFLHLAAVTLGGFVAGRLARASWAPIVVGAWATLSALLDWGERPAWYLMLVCAGAAPLALFAGRRGAR